MEISTDTFLPGSIRHFGSTEAHRGRLLEERAVPEFSSQEAAFS